MKHQPKSIRPFIGTKDYAESRNFYRDLGFQEIVLSPQMSYFNNGSLGFYLQNAYVEDWINNTMVFMEVDDVDLFWDDLMALNLTSKYETIKLLPVRELEWGKECFVHDPAGNLWHFGEFNSK